MLQQVLAVWRIAGKKEELIDGNGPASAQPFRVHNGIESDQRNGSIRGMRRDAMLTRAQDRVASIDAVQRVAAASGSRLLHRARGSRK